MKIYLKNTFVKSLKNVEINHCENKWENIFMNTFDNKIGNG